MQCGKNKIKETKQLKQITCHNWLKSMKKNDSVVTYFENALNNSNEMQERRVKMLHDSGLNTGLSKAGVLAVFSVIQEIIDKVETNAKMKQVGCNVIACRKRLTAELSWTVRAQVCCFYYHPALGNKDLSFTGLVYSLSPKTIEGWCTKSSMIVK